jgi:class 3 adenylate cyclase
VEAGLDQMPLVRYARTPDGIQLAYQVFGEGPRDLLVVWGGISHIELFWDDPTLARIFRRLASFARVIQFDRRGTGMSDRSPGTATLEDRMQDVSAVLAAVGSETAAILGESESAPMTCLFAATYPERTSALILYGPVIRMLGDATFPWAASREVFYAALDATTAEWGSEDLIWGWAPTVGDDPRARQFFSRFMRMSASPGAYRDQMLINADIDVRRLLPLVTVPTLVLHRGGDTAIPVGQGRYAARNIPGARYVELPGEDHLLIGGDPEPLLDEIEQFLTGVLAGRAVDRIVATIVFTDIVGSTELAARLGDGRWRKLLDEHDALLRRLLPPFSGRVVNTTGDGMLASFDGPARAVGWALSATAAAGSLGIEVRAGAHTGECELRGRDLAGLAVHVAARIGSMAAPGEVLVSETVRDLVAGSGIVFSERGTHTLKGVPDPWSVYAAGSGRL